MVPARSEMSITWKISEVAASGPPAKKLTPRTAGPGSARTGNPPAVVHDTRVRFPVRVQPVIAGTTS
jgi:hypothetical protein